MQLFFYSLIGINIFSFVLFGMDKYKARKGFRRIPEKTLVLIALCGGSIGALCGMRLFRHKTKHRLFTVGVPFILFLQMLLLACYLS